MLPTIFSGSVTLVFFTFLLLYQLSHYFLKLVLVVDIIFPGVSLASFPAALIAAAGIGLVNATIKPVLSVLSLPINILSLGAFSLVINGFCFWLASVFVPGFQVSGLLAFIFGPVILSFVNTFLTNYFAEKYPNIGQEQTPQK